MTTTPQYDVANHLRNEEERHLYIEAAFEEAGDDAAFIARALGDVARARGTKQVARDAASEIIPLEPTGTTKVASRPAKVGAYTVQVVCDKNQKRWHCKAIDRQW